MGPIQDFFGWLTRRRREVGMWVVSTEPELHDLALATFHAELRRRGAQPIRPEGGATTEQWRVRGQRITLESDAGFGDGGQVTLSGRVWLVNRIAKAVRRKLDRPAG